MDIEFMNCSRGTINCKKYDLVNQQIHTDCG